MQAINTYAQPIVRYPSGIINWPKDEIEATDIMTRKLLTMDGGFTPSPAPCGCTLSGKREAKD